jgi:hypothetical protein
MARKRARRRKNGRFVAGAAKSNPGRKRRKRRSHSVAVARRRSVRASSNPRRFVARRRARRNPPLLRGVSGTVKSVTAGVMNGLSVVGGQVIARKIKGAAQGILPASTNVSTGLPGIATTSAAALAVSVLSAMFAPSKYRRQSEFVIAGAWSEAINCALAASPVAPYLSAFPVRRSGVAAWPMRRGVGVNAWPQALPRSTGRVSAWPMPRVVGGFAPAGTGTV